MGKWKVKMRSFYRSVYNPLLLSTPASDEYDARDVYRRGCRQPGRVEPQTIFACGGSDGTGSAKALANMVASPRKSLIIFAHLSSPG